MIRKGLALGLGLAIGAGLVILSMFIGGLLITDHTLDGVANDAEPAIEFVEQGVREVARDTLDAATNPTYKDGGAAYEYCQEIIGWNWDGSVYAEQVRADHAWQVDYGKCLALGYN